MKTTEIVTAPVKPVELRKWRGELGWTQREAASHIGCSLKTYRSWEQAQRVMRFGKMVRTRMSVARKRGGKS